MTKILGKKFFIHFLIFFISLCIYSKETNSEWIIAAEKFVLIDTSPVYEMYAELIPTLILEKISSTGDRITDYNEVRAVQLYSLSQKKLELIKERAALIGEKDFILLSSDSFFEKNQKRRSLEKKIKDKDNEIKELFSNSTILNENKNIEVTNTQKISTWKNSASLYSRTVDSSLAKQLYTQKIAGLITGTIEDIAGYMLVTLTIETGLDTGIITQVSEVSEYDELPQLIENLVSQLFPQIARKPPVQLFLSVYPEHARIYIDGSLLLSHTEPVTILSGKHTITASADGYETSAKTAEFSDAKSFSISIDLQKALTITKTLSTAKKNSLVYIDTKYYGETPSTISFPLRTVFGEIIDDDIHTFFLYTPIISNSISNEDTTVFIKTNTKNTKSRIEKQRSLLYWSLGALYLSLPFSMISYGITTNQVQAFKEERLPKNQETVDEINYWVQFSNISSGISITLGVNFTFQLIRYLLAADQVLPKQIKE